MAVILNEEAPLVVELKDVPELIVDVPNGIDYIPGYREAELERRKNEEERIANEEEREAYYEEIQEKVENGEFHGEPGPQGLPGEPGPQGPQGEPGKSGVHIGTEEPTDDSNVWIDLDEGYELPDIENIVDIVDIITPKNNAKGELVHITDALPLATFENKVSGNVKQEGEPSPTSPQEIEVLEGDLSFKVDNGLETIDENYQEQIVPLDLKRNWVGAINDNIKDYLVTDKKKYWLVKNVGKMVLDGSEDWSLNSSYNAFMLYSKLSKGGNVMSNYYRGINQGLATNDNVILFNPTTLYIKDTSIKNTTEFKNHLKELNDSGKPLVAYFPLAQPYTEDLGELPEPIKTFEGVNNIQLLANLDTEIEVKYAQDIKKYVNEMLGVIENGSY